MLHSENSAIWGDNIKWRMRLVNSGYLSSEFKKFTYCPSAPYAEDTMIGDGINTGDQFQGTAVRLERIRIWEKFYKVAALRSCWNAPSRATQRLCDKPQKILEEALALHLIREVAQIKLCALLH